MIDGLKWRFKKRNAQNLKLNSWLLSKQEWGFFQFSPWAWVRMPRINTTTCCLHPSISSQRLSPDVCKIWQTRDMELSSRTRDHILIAEFDTWSTHQFHNSSFFRIFFSVILSKYNWSYSSYFEHFSTRCSQILVVVSVVRDTASEAAWEREIDRSWPSQRRLPDVYRNRALFLKRFNWKIR